jgi:hypothetical protein
VATEAVPGYEADELLHYFRREIAAMRLPWNDPGELWWEWVRVSAEVRVVAGDQDELSAGIVIQQFAGVCARVLSMCAAAVAREIEVVRLMRAAGRAAARKARRRARALPVLCFVQLNVGPERGVLDNRHDEAAALLFRGSCRRERCRVARRGMRAGHGRYCRETGGLYTSYPMTWVKNKNRAYSHAGGARRDFPLRRCGRTARPRASRRASKQLPV